MLFAAATILLLVALLAIPVTLDFRLSLSEAFTEDVRLRWAFGLVRMRIPLRQEKRADPAKEAPEKQARQGQRRRPYLRAIVQQRPLRQRLFRFVSDLWRAVQKQNVSLRLKLGLGDPADTGILWSILGPVSGYLGTLEDASVVIEPDFFETTLEFDGNGRLRLVPLRILYLVGGLLISPPILRSVSLAKSDAGR